MITLFHTSEYLYILDIKYNLLHIINKTDSSFYSLNPSKIDYQNFYSIVEKDTSQYYYFNKYKDALKIAQKDVFHYLGSCLSMDTIYTLVNYTTFKLSMVNRMIVGGNYAIISMVNNEIYKIYPIDTEGMAEYEILNDPTIIGNKLYLKIFTSEIDKEKLYYLAEFTKTNEKFMFKKIFNNELPEYYVNTKQYFNSFNTFLKYPYIYFNSTSEYQYINDSIKYYFDLTNMEMKVKDFEITDIASKDDIFSIINYNNGLKVYQFLIYDKKFNKLISRINLSDEINSESLLNLGLIDNWHYYYITDNNIFIKPISLLEMLK